MMMVDDDLEMYVAIGKWYKKEKEAKKIRDTIEQLEEEFQLWKDNLYRSAELEEEIERYREKYRKLRAEAQAMWRECVERGYLDAL